MLNRLRSLVRRRPDSFLRHLRGVIHVGANSGQERETYASYGLNVLWIEPILEVFDRLVANIQSFPLQRALRALVTDEDGVEVKLNIASNEGASSSIFELDMHRDIWPEVNFERTINLTGVTLPSLIRDEGVDLSIYDGIVLDTQGSELMILRGSESLLGQFRYIKTEVPDFSSYAGCCQLSEMDEYLKGRGFTPHLKKKFAGHPNGGSYYDVVYRRISHR